MATNEEKGWSCSFAWLGLSVAGFLGLGGQPPTPASRDNKAEYEVPPPNPHSQATKHASDYVGKLIWDAADKGDMKALEQLVFSWSGNNVLNWHNKHREGGTPLVMAAANGQLDSVRLLVAISGVIVDSRGDDGSTALVCAATEGYTDIVEVLLAAGADCNATTNEGMTALAWSAVEGHSDVARLLLAAQGININIKATSGEYANKTALGIANHHLQHQYDVTINKKKQFAHLLREAGLQEE